MEPISRLEKFLAKIGGQTEDITPLSRLEHFLEAIANRFDRVPDGNVLVVEYSQNTKTGVFSASESFATITNTFYSNKSVVARYGNDCFYLNHLSDGPPSVIFESLSGAKIRHMSDETIYYLQA